MKVDDSNQEFSSFGGGNQEGPKEEKAEATKPEPVVVEAKPDPEKTRANQRTAPVPVRATETGLLIGGTLEDQWRIASAYARSGMLPKAFKTPDQVLVGLQFCAELGLRPLLAMRQIAVINGTPSLFGDLPLACVRNSGLLEEITEYLVDEKGERIDFRKTPKAVWVAAVCEIKRKGQAKKEFTYSIDDAKAAKLWGTNVWSVHPKRMAQMRARNWLLKDEFGDVLGGAPIAEYDYNVSPESNQESITAEFHRVPGGEGDVNALFSKPVAAAQNAG